jgi:DNA replication protein DnaC
MPPGMTYRLMRGLLYWFQQKKPKEKRGVKPDYCDWRNCASHRHLSEDIDYRHPRRLERSRMAALVTCDFIRQRQNLHITGPTGTGKYWLAYALDHQACGEGLSVRYERMPRLLESLRLSRGDASLPKKLHCNHWQKSSC